MDVAKRILGAILAVTGLVVAVHLMVTPLYHDGSPDYPVWEIMNWFMAVGVLVMLAPWPACENAPWETVRPTVPALPNTCGATWSTTGPSS